MIIEILPLVDFEEEQDNDGIDPPGATRKYSGPPLGRAALESEQVRSGHTRTSHPVFGEFSNNSRLDT